MEHEEQVHTDYVLLQPISKTWITHRACCSICDVMVIFSVVSFSTDLVTLKSDCWSSSLLFLAIFS